jgi:hypothetical protein
MKASPKVFQPTPGQIAEAQSAVIDAIYELEATGVYSEIRQSLIADVFPAWESFWNSERQLSRLLGIKKGESEIARQTAENALAGWARKFRLTAPSPSYLSSEGEPLPWIMEWGCLVCHVSYDRLHPSSPMPRPGAPRPEVSAAGLLIPVEGPKPTENFSAFLKRIQPALKTLYRETLRPVKPKKAHRSKRNTEHYKWWVLAHCKGMSPGDIADILGVQAFDRRAKFDLIRHGVKSVTNELGLSGN